METLIQKERTHLFAPSINITVVAQFEGYIKEDRLYFAIKNAMRHQEILCSKVKLDEKGVAYFETPSEPVYRFEKMTKDWKSLVLEQERLPFDLENGEYMRFFYEVNKFGTMLLFVVHHLVGDGRSMSFFMQDVLKSLNGFDMDNKPIQLFSFDEIPKTARLNNGMKLALAYQNHKWKKTGKVFQLAERHVLQRDYWKKKVTGILYDQLEDKEVMLLKEACLQHEITINSFFACLFLMGEESGKSLGITVDLREESQVGMGNFSTGISVSNLTLKTNEFWENAKIVHKTIHETLKNEKRKYFLSEYFRYMSPTLIDSAFFAGFTGYENKFAAANAKLFGYSFTPDGISISNMMCLDLKEEENKYRLMEFFILPPLPANTKTMIGLSTFHDNLTITYHYSEELDTLKEENKFTTAMAECRRILQR